MTNGRELGFGDDIVSAMDNWGEKTLVPVSILMGKHVAECSANRAKFKENDIILTQAHASASSALLNLMSRSAGKKFDEVSGEAAQQLNLIAYFIQGIHLCEVSIVEASYVQAATLLRQEHEIISAIQELGVGRRKDGKTPHATVGVLKNMGRVYGDLSGAAHVSQSQLLHEIIQKEQEELKGPSILPVYHRDLARNLYSIHVCYIIMTANIVSEIHLAMGIGELSEEELKLLTVALGILSDEQLVNIETADLDQPISDHPK